MIKKDKKLILVLIVMLLIVTGCSKGSEIALDAEMTSIELTDNELVQFIEYLRQNLKT